MAGKTVIDFPMTDEEIKELENIEKSGKKILDSKTMSRLIGFTQEDIEAIDALVKQAFKETEDQML